MAIKSDEEFQAMQARLADLLPRLNERDRRLALATEAKSWGRGGITAVHQATDDDSAWHDRARRQFSRAVP
jgi:hypothetical protein